MSFYSICDNMPAFGTRHVTFLKPIYIHIPLKVFLYHIWCISIPTNKISFHLLCVAHNIVSFFYWLSQQGMAQRIARRFNPVSLGVFSLPIAFLFSSVQAQTCSISTPPQNPDADRSVSPYIYCILLLYGIIILWVGLWSNRTKNGLARL